MICGPCIRVHTYTHFVWHWINVCFVVGSFSASFFLLALNFFLSCWLVKKVRVRRHNESILCYFIFFQNFFFIRWSITRCHSYFVVRCNSVQKKNFARFFSDSRNQNAGECHTDLYAAACQISMKYVWQNLFKHVMNVLACLLARDHINSHFSFFYSFYMLNNCYLSAGQETKKKKNFFL